MNSLGLFSLVVASSQMSWFIWLRNTIGLSIMISPTPWPNYVAMATGGKTKVRSEDQKDTVDC